MDTYMFLTSLLQRIQHLRKKKEEIEINIARLQDKLKRYTSSLNQRKQDAQVALRDPSHPMNNANVWILKRMYDDMYSVRDLHDDICNECMRRDMVNTKLESIRSDMVYRMPQWLQSLHHVTADPKNHIYPLEVANRCQNMIHTLQPPPPTPIIPSHCHPQTNVGMNSFTCTSIGMSQT